MADLTSALKAAVDMYIWYFSLQFSVFGFSFSVASVFIWACIVSTAVWFTLKLDS